MTPADASLAELVVWASAGSTLLAVGTTAWNLLTSGARSNAKLIADMERRLQRVEDHAERAPSQDSMHKLELMIAEIRGDLGVMNQRLVPVAAIAERMQELLLADRRN